MMNRELKIPNCEKNRENKKDIEIKPIWESNKTNFGSRLLFIFFVISLIFEIIGNKTNDDNYKISHRIKNLPKEYSAVFTGFGYYLAKFSDILDFVQKAFKTLYDILYPIFKSIFIAIFDIFTSLLLCVAEIIELFFGGYANGIKNVYYKFSTYGISWVLIILGPLLFFSIFESIGIKLNFNKLRPTYYVIGLANNIYYFVMTFAYLYGIIVKITTRFNEVVYDILEYIFPWLKPIINSLYESNKYVRKSINKFVMAPLIGIVNGFKSAIVRKDNKDSCLSTIIGCIGFMWFLLIALKYLGFEIYNL